MRELAREIADVREMCTLCDDHSGPYWEGLLLILEAAFEVMLDDESSFENAEFEWPAT